MQLELQPLDQRPDKKEKMKAKGKERMPDQLELIGNEDQVPGTTEAFFSGSHWINYEFLQDDLAQDPFVHSLHQVFFCDFVASP